MDAVDRGAAWLDSKRPGWELEIDLGSLDMSACSRCIMGQLGWHIHELKQAHDLWFAFDHGFVTFGIGTNGYELLDEAWTALIKNRLDQGVRL